MKSRVTVTILVFVAIVVSFATARVSKGRIGNSQGASEKGSRICDPADCRISQNKRPANCVCRYSVILIDIGDKGLQLTNVENGVDFDLNSEGFGKQRISWTASGSTNAILILDRNGNHIVDNGAELFGNHTPQIPTGSESGRNGFLALAYYEMRGRGGNSDHVINSQDALFSNLRLWCDWNHNGISEPAELRTLKEVGIQEISLDYERVDQTDRFGNLIRYRADLFGPGNTKMGTAYDVVLVPAQ